MVALQASIGALNDLVDAPSDAGRKPGKPIPAGHVTRTEARLIVALGAGVGVGLASLSSPALALLGIAILAIGYAYDLRAKGTAWSWLPFAVGIPLLPVFGWFGAEGTLPAAFGILLPVAVAAGAGLAIANARADWERDLRRRAGLRRHPPGADASLGGRGRAPGWGRRSGARLRSGCAAVTPARSSPRYWQGRSWPRGSRSVVWLDAARRERAWEIEAVGVALLAVAWLVGYGALD